MSTTLLDYTGIMGFGIYKIYVGVGDVKGTSYLKGKTDNLLLYNSNLNIE